MQLYAPCEKGSPEIQRIGEDKTNFTHIISKLTISFAECMTQIWDFKFVLITKFRMRFHFYHNHCYMTSCLFFFFSFKTNELWLAVFTWLRTEGWGNYLRDWLWIYNFSWVYVIIDWLVSIYYKKLDFQGHEIMTNLSILYTSSIE